MRRSCSFKITKHPPWQLWHNPADFSCYFAVLSASLNVNPITKAFVFPNKGTVFRGSDSSGFNHLSWGELTNNHLGIPFMTDLGRSMKEGVVGRKRRWGRSPTPFFCWFFFDKCIGFAQCSSKLEYDIPPATDGSDFRVAIFLDWTVVYFRSLQSILKEGRKGKSPALDLLWPMWLKITHFTTTQARASWPAWTDMFSFPF